MDVYLQKALDAMRQATARMTPAELLRHKPGKWSTAEIIEHASLAYGGTYKLLQWCLATGKLSQDKPTEKHLMMTRFVIVGESFPPGLPAPAFAMPRGIAPESVMTCLHAALIKLDAAISSCLETFGAAATLGRHQVLGPLTAEQWCKFHWVHTVHHASQIEELRRWLMTEGVESCD